MRNQYIDYLKNNLSTARFKHVLGVEEEAIYIAKKYGVDVSQVQKAALIHDLTKELPRETTEEILAKNNISWSINSNLYHGETAAVIAQEKFGETDQQVLEAVRVHTFGKKGMDDVAKVLYVADFCEPNRTISQAIQVHNLVGKLTLDELVLYVSELIVAHLSDTGKKINEDTKELIDSLK